MNSTNIIIYQIQDGQTEIETKLENELEEFVSIHKFGNSEFAKNSSKY